MDVVVPKGNGREAFMETTLKAGVKVIFAGCYTADIISENGLMQSCLWLTTKPAAGKRGVLDCGGVHS